MAHPDITKTGEGLDSLAGKLVYVVGPGLLQNELMAFFLEQHIGVKGLIVSDMRCATGKNTHPGGRPSLILFDCHRKEAENIFSDLRQYGQGDLSDVPIALFNVDPSTGIEQEAISLGVKGFFYEHDPPHLFPKGVAAILDKQLWVSREIMSKCVLGPRRRRSGLPKGNTKGLTQRELEILAMVAVGAKNEAIAKKLFISSRTVKTHVYNIFKKIGVSNRLQAALWAANNL